MATFEVDCVGCNRRFTAKAPNAKWHSAACKKRAARVRAAEVAEAAAVPAPSLLVDRLRADLEAAGVADTFDGLLALELAGRVVKAGPQGFSMLARELRTVKAAALGEVVPADGAPAGDDEGPTVTDPGVALLLEIEERRDSKLAQAAAAG